MTRKLIGFQVVCALAASLMTAAEKDATATADVTAVAKTPASDATGGSSDEIGQLRKLLVDQQRQIDELRHALGQNSGESQFKKLGEVASTTPVVPPAVSAPASTTATITPQKEEPIKQSQLSLQIGSAYITPVGFLDFTGAYRDTSPGSGIGTNFGNFPYRNSSNVAGRLSEFRLSTQNSRIGARIDAMVKGAKVLAYWESDFLGAVPANAAVSSNSDTFRLRLYWVDVLKGKLEFLGGQSWSMITPGRKGISPIPGDLFYSQDIDVNYQAGLTWGRIPQFRMVYHMNDAVAAGISFEAAEQYIGGSGGGGTSVLPGALATAYANQLNNGNTTLNVPNVHPDMIAKIAFDPRLSNGHGLHFEAAGIERTFKTYNPLNGQHYTTAGGALQGNMNYELVKGFRFLTNNYWSDGGGRYIFGAAPDLVVRGDGSISLIHSSSTVSGFELTHGNTQLYTYYGGILIGRDSVIDPSNGKQVGYGYTGSSNGQNRTIQEGTFGFTRTFWKDPRYGALAFMGQYSYFTRNPWFVAAGTPRDTHMNEIFFNMRYTLPGSAPMMK